MPAMRDDEADEDQAGRERADRALAEAARRPDQQRRQRAERREAQPRAARVDRQGVAIGRGAGGRREAVGDVVPAEEVVGGRTQRRDGRRRERDELNEDDGRDERRDDDDGPCDGAADARAGREDPQDADRRGRPEERRVGPVVDGSERQCAPGDQRQNKDGEVGRHGDILVGTYDCQSELTHVSRNLRSQSELTQSVGASCQSEPSASVGACAVSRSLRCQSGFEEELRNRIPQCSD